MGKMSALAATDDGRSSLFGAHLLLTCRCRPKAHVVSSRVNLIHLGPSCWICVNADQDHRNTQRSHGSPLSVHLVDICHSLCEQVRCDGIAVLVFEFGSFGTSSLDL